MLEVCDLADVMDVSVQTARVYARWYKWPQYIERAAEVDVRNLYMLPVSKPRCVRDVSVQSPTMHNESPQNPQSLPNREFGA